MVNFPLGTAFPEGLFVAQDADNTGAAASTHKYVPFKSIADALGLAMDTTWNPRKIGRDPLAFMGRRHTDIKGLKLPKGTENSLCVKLENAAKSLQKGNNETARNQLKAFLNEVQAQGDKKLVGKQAGYLGEVVAAITGMFD